MKETIKTLSATLLTAAALLLAACGGDGGKTVGFGKAEAERSVAITDEEGVPACHVHIELACAKENGGEAAKAINATLAEQLLGMEGVSLQAAADSFANSYTRDYRRNFAPLYREDRSDPDKRAWYEFRYSLSGEAAEGREGVTVYKATVDYYEGGAHGINQLLVFNFDNQTGRLLMLSDLFVPGFEQALADKLLEALLKQTEAKDLDDLHNKGYLYSMDMFAPENFILGKDGITFIYNPYEIAPYAMGKTELILTYDDMDDIMKKP